MSSLSEEPRSSCEKAAEKALSDSAGLPIDRVDVWVVKLAETAFAPDMTAWLTADEHGRAERFAFDRDRRRFQAGRGALRAILASYLDCVPSEIAFAYGKTGKPQLDEPQAASGLRFNSSGSADLAVCAVTCDGNVGIDIEHVRDAFDPDLARYAFSESERAEFNQIPPNQKTAAFYRTWTRKEAYLKAVGCGLSRPLASFSVSVKPSDAPRLIRDDSALTATECWSFADVDPAPGWLGTLVHSGTPRPVALTEWLWEAATERK